MPYTLDHQVLPDYLEIQIQGTIIPGKEVSEGMERWKKVATLCKSNGRNMILAFIDLKGQHSTSSKFSLVNAAQAIEWRVEYKLAVVVRNRDQFDHLSFTETAMNNLGYEMKLFLKKREARKWLLS